MKNKTKNVFYTIGYEGKTIDEFILCLKLSDIKIVLDVREMPLSRKKGFSKTKLSLKLKEEGLDYIHIRDLGSPKEIRKTLFKTKDYNAFFKAFLSHLEKQQEAIATAYETIFNSICCLMCYEKESDKCHRSIVAKKLIDRDKSGLTVVNI